MLRYLAGSLIVAWALTNPAWSGILYLAESNVIWITDFPEEWPCTPALLWQADRAFRWGKVRYDEASGTFTVDAQLRIGNNAETETWFRIGQPGKTCETVVVNGDVTVQPDWIGGENEGQFWYTAKRRYVNRLSIGAPGASNATAVLKLAPGRSLLIGTAAGGHGGQLVVQHGAIRAAVPGVSNRMEKILLHGNTIILRDAVISGVRGYMSAGAGVRWQGTCVLERVTFEDGGVGLVNATLQARRCVFRNLDIAVKDEGSLEALLTDCVFEGNARNWFLQGSSHGIVGVDCTWRPPRQADHFSAWDNPKTKRRQYPRLVSRRHLIVETRDDGGKPIANANVAVTSEKLSEMPLVFNGRQTTGADGRTAGQGAELAILATECVTETTDTPDQPRTWAPTYTIRVEAPGYRSAMSTGVVADQSWKIIPIKLSR